MPVSYFFLLLSLYLHYSNALVVYVITANLPLNITYSSTPLPSYYSTLGSSPSSPLKANLSVLSLHEVDSATCTFQKDISGDVVVYQDKEIPTMHGCNHDSLSQRVALARTVQKHGGVALILIEAEEVYFLIC